MHDLKNCPFCGGEAYLCASTYDGCINNDKETAYFVKCSKCHLQSIKRITKDGVISHGDAIKYVTDLWNARPLDKDKPKEKCVIHLRISRKDN